MSLPPIVAVRMRSTQSQPLPSGRQISIRATSGDAVRTRSSAPWTESAVCTSAPQLASQSETASAQLSLSSTTRTRRPERSSRRTDSTIVAIRRLFAGPVDDRNPSWREGHQKKPGGVRDARDTPRSEERRRQGRRRLVGGVRRGRERGIELGVEIENVPRVRSEVALPEPGRSEERRVGK